MPSPLAVLRAGFDYLKRNPTELFTVARHAAGFRAVVPLDALRWFVANSPPNKKAPQDVVIGEKPPSITFGATIDLMGTKVRANAAIRIDELRLSPEELRISVRLSDVKMEVIGQGGDSPVAALLKSGALDLSKPGNLANFMPKRPPALVEAKDDRLVLDLMKVPKIADNPKVKTILGVITPVLVIRDITVAEDHIQISWRPRITGLAEALSALRAGVAAASNGAHR
jgi:hypothetical protein